MPVYIEGLPGLNYDQAVNHKDVNVWTVRAGEITELLIHGSVFEVRDDYPKELNPIQVAQDFLKVFDISKTKVIRKVKSMSGDNMTSGLLGPVEEDFGQKREPGNN